MNYQLLLWLGTALSVGLIHTFLGPDHYLPFIVLAKARKWSATKTTIITTLCGIGHVLSAVLLGVVAIGFGVALTKLKFIETFRGEIAAWLLIGFGFAYFLWGVRYALKNKKHTHTHFHADGLLHQHVHNHHESHAHLHSLAQEQIQEQIEVQHSDPSANSHPHPKKSFRELIPWVLFIIFILGPCEPLIPLIIYPALKGMTLEVILIAITFGIATLIVMLFMVLTATFGVKKLLKFPFFERYGNALAGGIICSCGLAIKFFGL
ncbi:MAG: hypothetical protein M1561_04700 [Gammaproteobacteria bacterium]|nr:hypothetical protein [Gammaproteobacteria bacterium]